MMKRGTDDTSHVTWCACYALTARRPDTALNHPNRRAVAMPFVEHWRQTRERWSIQSYYQRFESLIAIALTAVIGLIIVVAAYRLGLQVVAGLLLGAFDPLDHRTFQLIFGEIMTVLIALEFNHTLQYVVHREQSVIQVKTVILIALLALARKFIILEVHEVAPSGMIGLASITFALGVTYWLMRDRDDRATVQS
jgi:uncharacterized membrane protein (DUF373 family)